MSERKEANMLDRSDFYFDDLKARENREDAPEVYTHDEKGQRIDVHRPSAINPGDYTYRHVGDKRKHPVDGGPGGTCHHCGKAIRWEVHFLHNPSGRVVTFGETCTSILEMSSDRIEHEMVLLKRAAQNEKFKTMREQDWQERRESFDAEYPELRDFFSGHDFDNENNYFVRSMKESYEKWGSLLPRQTSALQDALKRRREAIQARLAQPVPTEALPEGRYVIEGEILSSKYDSQSQFPGRRMTVMLPDGNKVYGTMPRSIEDAATDYKGLVVQFTAQVTRSNRDDHFGFFKRPTNAKVV